jgi:Family of unknown function (DUF6464)
MAILKAWLIFLVALIPAVCTWWLMRKAESQARERLRRALRSPTRYGRSPQPFSPDHQYVEGMGYLLGDRSCRWNARSAYLRCTVNPEGPCENCPHYEALEFEEEPGTRVNTDARRGMPM